MARGQAKIVKDRFEYLSDERMTLEERWIENYKKYHIYREYTTKEIEDLDLGMKTDIRIPREFSYLETKKPRVINALFAARPIMKVNPLTNKAERPAENFEIMMQNDFLKYLYEAVFYSTDQSLMYGPGVFYFYWLLKNENGELIDRPGFGFKDIFNFYIPKGYVKPQTAPFVINRVIKLKSELEKRARKGSKGKGYFNLDKLTSEQYEKNVTSGRNYVNERLEILDIAPSGYNKGSLHLDFVEVIECWSTKEIITLGNRDTLIRHDKNEFGFIPFFGIKSYPDSLTFYNKGDIDYMGDAPQYATDVKNLRMDILKKIAHPGQIVSRRAQIDPIDLIPKPYQTVYTYDMDGYREIKRSDVKSSMYNEEAIAEANIENSTGIYSYLKGGYAPRGETARTTIEMKEASMERLSTMVFFNSIVTFTDMAYKYLQYCRKKMDNKRFFRYMNKKGDIDYLELDKDDITEDFEIIPNNITFRTLASAEAQTNMIGMFDRLLRSGGINKYELNKLLLNSFDILGENKILLRDDETHIIEYLRENQQFIPQIIDAIMRREATMEANMIRNKPPMGRGALSGATPEDMLGGEGRQTPPEMLGPNAETILDMGGNNPGGLM